MKYVIVVTAFFLVPAVAHAQQTSIAQPTPPKQAQETAKPRKTTEERFQACMQRHIAKERVGKRTGERCRNLAARTR